MLMRSPCGISHVQPCACRTCSGASDGALRCCCRMGAALGTNRRRRSCLSHLTSYAAAFAFQKYRSTREYRVPATTVQKYLTVPLRLALPCSAAAAAAWGTARSALFMHRRIGFEMCILSPCRSQARRRHRPKSRRPPSASRRPAPSPLLPSPQPLFLRCFHPRGRTRRHMPRHRQACEDTSIASPPRRALSRTVGYSFPCVPASAMCSFANEMRCPR